MQLPSPLGMIRACWGRDPRVKTSLSLPGAARSSFWGPSSVEWRGFTSATTWRSRPPVTPRWLVAFFRPPLRGRSWRAFLPLGRMGHKELAKGTRDVVRA